MDTKLLEKANQIIKSCDSAGFGVLDENGYPTISAISLVKPESVTELYFATGLAGNKVKRLQKNNKSSICVFSGSDDDLYNITLVGTAEILTDQETKIKYWLDWFSHVYEGGITDPNYCVVKFTTKRVSMYINHEDAEIILQTEAGQNV